jgi:HEAT repeat protein
LWRICGCALVVGLLGGSGRLSAQPAAPDLENAQWIWLTVDPNLALNGFPGGLIYLRTAFVLPAAVAVTAADLVLTCDNLFAVTLNGQTVGESENPDAWNQPQRFDVAGLLTAGSNVLAIEAVNTVPGPAGLLVKLVAQLGDGTSITCVSDGSWKANDTADVNWKQPEFNSSTWRAVRVLGPFGIPPWGKFAVPAKAVAPGTPAGSSIEAEASASFVWPAAIVFLADDCSLYIPRGGTASSRDSLTVTMFNPRDSRAFPEHDLPAPLKVGRKLLALRPAAPGSTPEVLFDAGAGAIGSPTVSFDGAWVYLSMARAGDGFYHIYRLPAAGGVPQPLTAGPFHDIDPCELPNGRIAFTSTRTGTFEEYHNPPSRALFTMLADGSDIRSLTSTFVFDNEPEVLADGRVVFIRSDNFFDRGKVETLLHAVHPDGTSGLTEFGLEVGPEYGGRLRAFNCGSPAPLPDGRVAFVTGGDITLGRPGSPMGDWQHLRVPAGDVAALPDGRLLCTLARPTSFMRAIKEKRPASQFSYEKIGIINPDDGTGKVTIVYDSPGQALHSPVFLGARLRPPLLAPMVQPTSIDAPAATGVLYCQNARFTLNTTAGWPHVRAIRVLAGRGLTTRSSHSYIVHAGSEVIELGTVPLAPDGSFAVEVPADTGIAFQAVDAEGRSELNEMSWITVRPGERRGCVGCHQPRTVAPTPARPFPQATRVAPLRLVGQGNPHRFRGNNAAVTGLMEMQFDRYREVAGLNRHGDTQDPAATGAEEVARLVAQLGSPDAGLRLSAAQRLAVFRAAAAGAALAACLRDEDREVRVGAAMALAVCGGRDAVPALLLALVDPDPLVAQAAAIALENLTCHTEPAFDPFAPQRGSERWVNWIQSTAWEDLEATLIQTLTDAETSADRRAAVALGRIGQSDRGRETLRDYLRRERDHNPHPAWRPNHLGDGARFNASDSVNPRSLQAVTRALGYGRDNAAVPLLAETLQQHGDPGQGNLFLAEAAVEALGLIGTPDAENALIDAFGRLGEYPNYTSWYGDHGALMACHASPIHSFAIEALDALGSTHAAAIVPALIMAVPTDFDRALFLGNDDYETLTGRVIRRNDPERTVVETCLAILGDPAATPTPRIAAAIARIHGCWAGTPGPEIRAAQILSLACSERQYEARVRAALARYMAKETTIKRVFDTGIPVVDALPLKHWCCFYLARTLGNLRDPASAEPLLTALAQSQPEAASGFPDPLGPGVHFLHNDLTPCWRAAVAWALGRIGDTRALPVLLGVVGDLLNAPDTRFAAAQAVGAMAPPATLPALEALATDYPETATRRALLQAGARLAGRPVAAPAY